MPKTRRAQRVRRASEFSAARMLQLLTPPRPSIADAEWSAAMIVEAKRAQTMGSFAMPARMAKKMREDDAIYGAWQVRISPESALSIALEPANGPRGKQQAAEAEALFGERGVGLRPETRQDILIDLVDHGVAFARNTLTPREDGSRVDLSIAHWPAEHCRWDDVHRVWMTHVDGGADREIRHGNGEWIVVAKTTREPYAKHAAIIPAAVIWSTHWHALSDWNNASYSHANAKVTGELPPAFAFFDADGALTEQAIAFLEILKAAAGAEQLAAIVPPGSTLTMLANPSTAHQIWLDIVNNRERAAQRVYNGTDASLGSPGGAPGVDILSLFGVSNTIGEGDLNALERGFQEGAIDVWAALNFGDSSSAPRFAYVIPNADEQANREAYALRMSAALSELERLHALGFALSPEQVAETAERYDVSLPVPPAAQTDRVAPIAFAPTDITAFVRVWEARASQGLPPMGDERDDLMVAQLKDYGAPTAVKATNGTNE